MKQKTRINVKLYRAGRHFKVTAISEQENNWEIHLQKVVYEYHWKAAKGPRHRMMLIMPGTMAVVAMFKRAVAGSSLANKDLGGFGVLGSGIGGSTADRVLLAALFRVERFFLARTYNMDSVATVFILL